MAAEPIALVGLGAIGVGAHLPAIRRSTRVRLAAVVDPDPARRAAVVDVPAYADLHTVLVDDAIRGVVLATPPWVTTSLAACALSAGRTVLAEKPIGTSVAAASPLAGLPADELARLQVGLTYRHDPALELLHAWIAGGRLGAGPLLCRAHIYDEARDPTDPEHAARVAADLAHGPPVLHEGSHVFDWLTYLFDAPPNRIADAWALRTDPQGTVPNLNGARLEFPGGSTALVEFGWWADALPRCELSVLGDRGLAVLDGFTFALRLHVAGDVESYVFPGDRTERCFDRQLDRFADLLTGRLDRGVPGFEDGLASLRLSEQVAATAGEA